MKNIDQEKIRKHKEEIVKNMFTADPLAFFEAAIKTGYQQGFLHGALIVALISAIIITIWK